MRFFSLSTLVVLATLFALATAVDNSTRTGDKSFPACDSDKMEIETSIAGVGYHWQTSDDPNFYVAPGRGSCGLNYTDQSSVICVNPGWLTSASKVNRCNVWVQVLNPTNGVVTQGRILDTCGAVPNSTFGCNDLYVSKRMFEQLAGNQRDQALQNGRIDGHLQWRVITEPCWACYAGLPGKLANGTQDACSGQDQQGFTRCGRKHGGERIVGVPVNNVCSQNINTCAKADAAAATTEKYKGNNAAKDASCNKIHPHLHKTKRR